MLGAEGPTVRKSSGRHELAVTKSRKRGRVAGVKWDGEGWREDGQQVTRVP